MACVRKRRGKWVIDFYDQFGDRHWETVGTNKKEAEEKLAEKMLEIRKGAYNPAVEPALYSTRTCLPPLKGLSGLSG